MTSTATTNRFSVREFKGAAIQAVAAASAAIRKINVDDEVFRKLRLTMVASVDTREHLVEALTVIMRQITERATSRKIRFKDVADLIAGPSQPIQVASAAPVPEPVTAAAEDAREPVSEAGEGNADEDEWVLQANLVAEPMWDVDSILDPFRGADGKVYFLVRWAPTAEPASNIPRHLIAAFHRQRSALARATFFEDEAEEAQEAVGEKNLLECELN